MKRDVALALSCVTIFALALFYIVRTHSSSTARERNVEERIEERMGALEEKIASLSAPSSDRRLEQMAVRPSTELAPRPTRAWPAAPDPRQPVAGAAGPSSAPQGAATTTPAPPAVQSALQQLRRLLDANPERGIAVVDNLTESATDLGKKQFAMRAMSLLAERNDPAVEDALNRYTEADSGLLRVHAAKLLQRHGDPSALASVASDLATKLDATDDVQRKLQVLGLLQWAGDPGSAPKILPALHDQSSVVRQRAVLALGQFDDESVRAEINTMLSDPDPAVQQAAQTALRRTP